MGWNQEDNTPGCDMKKNKRKKRNTHDSNQTTDEGANQTSHNTKEGEKQTSHNIDDPTCSPHFQWRVPKDNITFMLNADVALFKDIKVKWYESLKYELKVQKLKMLDAAVALFKDLN